MRLSRLDIRDFARHEHTKIDLKPLTIVRGPNESGKSSIRDAIEWLLTGMARDMDYRKDEHELIRTGADSMSVTGLFRDDKDVVHRITRTATHTGSTLEYQLLREDESQPDPVVGIKEAQEEIEKVFGATTEIITLLHDVFAMVNLSPRELKTTLQEIVMERDVDKLLAYLNLHGFGNLPDKHARAMSADFVSKGIVGAYDYAVERRREAGRDDKGTAIPELLAEPEDLEPGTIDELGDRREIIDEERLKIAGSIGRSEGGRETMESVLASIKSDLTDLMDELQGDDDLSAELERVDKSLDVAKKDLELMEASRDAPSDNERLNVALEVLKANEARISKTSLSVIRGMCEAQSKEIDAFAADGDAIESARRSVMGLVRERSAVKNAIRDNDSLKVRIQSVKSDIGIKSRKLDEMGADTIDDKFTQDDVERFADQIEKINTSIAYLERKGANESERSDLIKKKNTAQARHDTWDKIAELLNPKSRKIAELFGDRFETLRDEFVSAAETIGIEVKMESDFRILAKTGGAWRSLHRCCTSERYRVGVALQSSVCSLLGFGTLVADWGDVLYDYEGVERRSAMSAYFASIGSKMNVLVLATGEPEPIPASDDVVGYGLLNGDLITM